ncbi:MAG: tetratricopeptide repeat protein [Thermodesulfobacteriota bacterium]
MVNAELHLLGPPFLIIGRRLVRLHSAKTLALLTYLVLEAHSSHSREKLAGLLWGESPENRARHSLRQALYSLRRTLGDLTEECLVLAEGAASFRPHSKFHVDALEFLNLATADPQDLKILRQAVQLYKGLLLEGIELTDCSDFEEWLFFRRDALEQQALGLLQRLIDVLIRHNEYKESLTFARRLVAMDPLHEWAHRCLMKIHAVLGDRDSVRRQYRHCCEILARELGVEPAAETQAVYRKLIAVTISPTISFESLPSLQPADQLPTFPFLGRERELAVLQTWLNQAMAGHGGLILISGEAGIGKTRLVEEFKRRSLTGAVESALPIYWLTGRCYEPEARTPYTMWADALNTLATADWKSRLAGLPDVWLQQLARLTPDLAPLARNIEGVSITESQLRLFQGIVQSLAYLAKSCCLILFFDDLHWVDESSLELLHYVIRHLAESPLLIIGAYRPEMAVDHSSLEHLSSSTGDTGLSSLLKLPSLDLETVSRLLTHLGTELPRDLPDRLYQHSEGNPFFLVETLRTLFASGKLRREPNGRLVGPDEGVWPVPARVQDLIQARLSTLGEEHRRVLAAAAVIGRPFGLHLARRVSGLPELQVLGIVEQLLDRAFLAEKDERLPQQVLDFHHNYFRRAIYDGLKAVQRQTLHRRAARALLALHRARPGPVTEEIAYHYELADDVLAISYLIQAAQQAEALFAYHHATDLYTRALTLHRTHLFGDLPGRFDLLLAREAVLDRQARRVEQAEDITALLELAESLADIKRLAVACVRQAGLFTYTGQYDAAHKAGERALDLYRSAGDKAGEAQALRELGFLHWSASDYSVALQYSRAALQMHRQLGNVAGEATALHNLAEIYRGLGSPKQALEWYEQALSLHWAQQNRPAQGLTLYGMAHALRQLGQHDQAQDRYQQALAHLRASGDRLMTSRVHHSMASLQWEAGATNQALDHMNQALSISREIGYGPGIAHGLIALSYLYAQDKKIDLAKEHLRESLTWLRLMEDQVGLGEARNRLQALEKGTPHVIEPPATLGWFKAHVTVAEGKVYCEFESPMARR